MATFTDDFNRANENPIAAPWTTSVGSGVQILSNQVTRVSGNSASIVTGETFNDDQVATVEINVLGNFDLNGVVVRGDVTGNGYCLLYLVNQDRLQFYTLVNGVRTDLVERVGVIGGGVGFGNPPPFGTTIGLGIVGDTLTFYVNGVQSGATITRTTYTSGSVGVYTDSIDARLDNFVAEGLVASSSINSVDGDNIVTDGQQNVPVIVSGFAGDITSMSLRVGTDTIALTGLTGTGDNYTINLPDISALAVDTLGVPFSSAAYQVELVATDGVDTAAIDITREPKVGYALVETVSAVATQGSLFETRVGGAPFDGSQIYYPTADDTAIDSTGVITTNSTGFTARVWDVTSKTWEIVTFDAADIVAPIITVSGNAITTITVGDAAPVFTASTDDGSAVIVGGDTVDANTVGTYVITFDSTDAAGNVAIQVTRTVIVEEEIIPDTTAPVIILDPVTTVYNLNVDDVFVLPVATVTDDTDASRVITPDSNNVNTAVEGIYSVVYNATDAAGNVAETVTITVNVTAFNANAVIIVERQTNITYR